MRFCSFLNEPNISIRGRSFDKAWKQLLEYEENLDWPIECKTCEANQVCLKCIATIATESGSSGQIAIEYCNEIRELYKRGGE